MNKTLDLGVGTQKKNIPGIIAKKKTKNDIPTRFRLLQLEALFGTDFYLDLA